MSQRERPGMGQKATILFSEELWRRVRERADEHGISASQYVREATLAILFYETRDPEFARALERSRRLLRD